MASLVVGVAGAAIGSFFGPMGTSIGWALGSALGNALFAPKSQTPPHDLHIQGSSYGAFRKLIWGTVRISGNVIWETDLQEHDGGGKGKTPGQQTFTASFDVGLCETQVVQVLRFWAAGRLNYDVNQPSGPTIPFTFYDGNSAQLADPTEEATEGVGNVPAYRGISRVVFADWDMTQFGNSIPQLSFELATKGEAGNLRILQRNDAIGFTLGNFPIIDRWPTNGDPIGISAIRVSPAFSTAAGSPETFDPTTFADIAPGSAGPYPQWWSGPTPHYGPVGVYNYSSGASTCLWHPDAPTQISSSDDTPSIITETATAVNMGSHYEVFDSAKFLYVAGVPVGLYLRGATMTEDGTKLYVFTSASSGGTNTDHWYRIVDGVVDSDGTVTPNIDTIGWGKTSKPGSTDGVSQFENDGKYCWFYDVNSASASLFTIDQSGNFADAGFGTLSVIMASGSTAGLKVISPGLCGLAKGTSIVELSRVGARALTYLSEIVADLFGRAGLSSGQYDVTALSTIPVDGFVIESQMTVRAALETLMPAYFFDIVESDAKLKCVVRGGPSVVTFLDDDLAAHLDHDSLPSILSCVHTQDEELPCQISIAYMNKDADYQINTQVSQRMVTASRSVQTVQVPLVFSDKQAKQIADAWLYDAYTARDVYTWYSSRKYAKYEPTDVVTVQNKVIRITSKTEGANGVIKWEGVPSRAANYVQAGVAGAAFNPGQTIPVVQATQLVMLDIPLVADAGLPNGFYAAMAGAVNSSWPGAALFKSTDGTTYTQIGSTSSPAIIGTAAGALGNYQGGNTFDESNTVSVVIGNGGGELASVTELDVLNGSNEFLIGEELIQAKNCVLTAPSTYTLSGMLRGRRGTEFAIATHGAGERFIAAPILELDAPFAELGQARYYKAVTFGQSLATAPAVSFINYGAKLRPYSPAQLGGGVDASGNVTINWVRRTRIGGAWADGGDVPLSEATEAYVLQIWDANFHNVARIVNLVVPTFVYTAAMQVSDFGSQQQTIFVSVGQVGAYSLGAQASAQIPGAGGSNTSIITPITPYNNPPPQTGTGCTQSTVVQTTMSWASPVRVDSGDSAGGPDWVWDISFTTGSVASGSGRIQAFAGSGDQLPMGGTFTLEPCGFPLPPTKTKLPLSSLVSFPFYMTGNPNPGGIATLLPSTTYHLIITRPTVGAKMYCDLFSIL